MTTTRSLPPGFTDLRFQQEYAIDMALDYFANGAVAVVVDAPPGVGKTLLGEVVRREMSVPGVYLCKSHQLQEQAARDFPHAVVLKGRANYPTENDPTLTAADCNKRTNHDCDYCSSKSNCPYEIVKRDALAAELTITNLAYFFGEVNGPGRFSGMPLVILDECDLLEETVLENVELSYAARTLSRLGVDHIRWPKQKSAGIHGAGTVEHLRWLREVGEVAEDLVERYQQVMKNHPEDDATAKKLTETEDFARKVRRAEVGIEGGTWFYDETQSTFGPGVRFAPILVEQLSAGYFFNHARKFLCMSGTVGNGREWLREVGFTGPAKTIECPSPFSKESRQIRYAPVAALNKDNWAETWPATAAAVLRIRDLHPGERTLVHTASYAHARAIETHCGDPLVLAHQPDKELNKLGLQWFEETPGACLVSPVLGRGYDGADDKVRVIIVAKLPFPNFGDERINQRVHRSPHGRREGQLWMEAQVARALMQMTSRGTRHDNDWSVTYIIDEKFCKFWKDAQDQLSDWWKEALVWGGSWREEVEKARLVTV